MRDTIIIGAGLAGLMGALALAEAGRKPFVLAKGHGTTHWMGGTIDIWGAADDGGPRAAIGRLATTQPDHPYALLSSDELTGALDRFRALMAAAGYPYVGSLDRNVLLPTALGALRPTALMPATMAAGDVRLPGSMLIAGFHELRDFFPPLAAANLNAQGIAARGAYLELPPIERKLDFSTVTFARLFEQPAFREHVGRQLRALRGEATRIGLPAVLGLHNATGVVTELQALSGAQIFEIPTLPASVPGIRLFNIFERVITAAGGRLQLGSFVVRAEGVGDRLTSVYTEAAAREQRHQANDFLLATGGVAGGGVRTDHEGTVRETALGLPLRAPTGREQWFAPRFRAEEGHPIFRAGVEVNADLRPLDAAERVVYHNVTVGGNALAGADAIRERCYAGLALATGWKAGKALGRLT
jgi:glycerol-3-phosphate dehydrogenase subunit B